MEAGNGSAVLHPSLAANAKPSASYEKLRPNQPFIYVPYGGVSVDDHNESLESSFEHVRPAQPTTAEFDLITGGALQTVEASPLDWTYDKRRTPQAILDFLHLGPSNAVKDHDFMRREGFTMILVARDASTAARKLLSVDKAAEALGIEVAYVDVEGHQQLISAFDATFRLINDHLLNIHRSLPQDFSEMRQNLTPSSPSRRGKALVVCETGNDRSAVMVAAYIMAVYGKDMIFAIQFVSSRRFCCSFDDDMKRVLQSWDDLLAARRTVASDNGSLAGQPRRAGVEKRCWDDTVGVDDPSPSETDVSSDHDRFVGRSAFVPFIDGH